MKKSSTNILLLDIETAPNVGYTWGIWEQNVVKVIREWYILCCAVRWLGKRGRVLSLPDYVLYKTNPHNDRELVKEIREYLDKADIVIAHNGDAFDLKKINARIFFHELKPPSPYQSIDTLKIARRHFSFTSNKLNELAKFLKIGQKVETGGFELWERCLIGDKKAWRKMASYNLQDVVLLEKIYLKLRPWATSHPNLAAFEKKTNGICPRCKSKNIQSRGTAVIRSTKYRRFQCLDCGGWMKKSLTKDNVMTT
jgi:hypothetical protein